MATDESMCKIMKSNFQVVVSAHEKTQFTKDDWQMFFDVLNFPYQLTERMKKAKEKYNDIIE